MSKKENRQTIKQTYYPLEEYNKLKKYYCYCANYILSKYHERSDNDIMSKMRPEYSSANYSRTLCISFMLSFKSLI